jgi:AraC-like DNA-binding protein
MRKKTEQAYAVGVGTRQAIAKLVLLMQGDLDAEWTIEGMAKKAGYARHHFAHAFEQTMGSPPLEYLRILRLHRAAHRLATRPGVDLTSVANAAGYGSLKAFRRAFSREFGRLPSEFQEEHAATYRAEVARPRGELPPPPEGLSPRPTMVFFGPARGVSLRSPDLTPEQLRATMLRFFELARPHGAWRIGSASPAFGWTGGGQNRREFRFVFLNDDASPPEPPLEPWQMGAFRYARFDFDGSMAVAPALYVWIFREWMRASRWRYGFAPVLTLYDDEVWHKTGFQRARARILVPVERDV